MRPRSYTQRPSGQTIKIGVDERVGISNRDMAASKNAGDCASSNVEPFMLSIMILTRNRRNEILRALQSCIECSLPQETEFVIVDNASEDGTKEAVDRFFQASPLEYQYHYLSENIGAAAGRNEGLRRARGRYVYIMDDDAYIDGPRQSFFHEMIDYLVDHDDLFGITTSIYDTAIKCIRPLIASRNQYRNSYKKVIMFHGGSVLLDRQRGFDQKELFLKEIFKGMEELYPSLRSYFSGKSIIEMDNVRVIHQPSLHTRPSRRAETIYHYTGWVHIKLIFYPAYVYPLVYIMFWLRILKHLGIAALPEACSMLSKLNQSLARETVSPGKIVRLLKEFGFKATF